MIWLYIVAFQLIVGYVLMKLPGKSSWRAWIWLLPMAVVPAARYLVDDPRPWYRMLAAILMLFMSMKIVTSVYRYPAKGRLSVLQWLAYSLGWPGMDPIPFEQLGKSMGAAQKATFRSGLISLLSGMALLLLLSWLLHAALLPVYIACRLAFVPLIMIFHAGLFNIVAGLWGMIGVQLKPLMDAPWRSDTVSSFWGKRWNIAFIQMTTIALFMPLARKGKKNTALLLSFFVSGVFHEVALTLPVRAGYGLPMLYFLLQAIFVLTERRFLQHWPIAARKIWTILCIMLPFPLLLHPAFIHQVILPFLQHTGNLL